MKAQLTLGVVVALVLLLIVMMSLHDWTFTSTVSKQQLEASPAIVTEAVSGKMFDVDGKVKYAVKAKRASEFDFDQTLQLIAPRVVIATASGHWVIHAEIGSMHQLDGKGGQKIRLQQNVLARRTGAKPVNVKSESLYYWPRKGKLVSPGSVFIKQDQNTTLAGHLEAELGKGQLQLSRGVESHYVVPAS